MTNIMCINSLLAVLQRLEPMLERHSIKSCLSTAQEYLTAHIFCLGVSPASSVFRYVGANDDYYAKVSEG